MCEDSRNYRLLRLHHDSIVKEKRNLKGASFSSPTKRFKRSRERIEVDDSDAFRRTVHEFYDRIPNDKLLQVVKEKELF